MSTPEAGRHRAPARAKTPLTAFTQAVSTNASPAVKASAVLAVSGGLVASLGMSASATPAHHKHSAATQDLSSAAAPAFGDSSFSANAVAHKTTKLRGPLHLAAPAARLTPHLAVAASRSSHRASVNYGPITPVKAGDPGSAQFGAAVMSIAARYKGLMYHWGGTSPSTGFDCSGFVRYVMAQVGVSLPRTSSEQRAATVRIPLSEAVPGDLVFFPGHVGIYAGGGMMWDSPHTGSSIGKHAVYGGASYGRPR